MPCCFGIVVDAGNDYFAFDPRISGSPDDNLVRRVEVSNNQIVGAPASGVRVQAGTNGGGSRNRVEAVRVRRNVVSSNILGKGIYLGAGQVGQGLTAAGNSITDIEIDGNVITTGEGERTVDTDLSTAGGVVLIGGGDGGRDGSISDVRITNNSITTAYAGIRLIGGYSPLAGTEKPPQGNSVRCVRLSDNRVLGTTVPVFAQADVGPAVGNSVTFTLADVGSFAALLQDPVIDVDATKAAGC
ncbi:MAG: hypothetical protein HY701_07135 [Gemmatimonadetes bacterium]|nr:hypothetical protein [Gemmatimonadota bacterium]